MISPASNTLPVPATADASDALIRAQAQPFVGDAVPVSRDQFYRVLMSEKRDVQGTILNEWAQPMGYITRHYYTDPARTLFGFSCSGGAQGRLCWLSQAIA